MDNIRGRARNSCGVFRTEDSEALLNASLQFWMENGFSDIP